MTNSFYEKTGYGWTALAFAIDVALLLLLYTGLVMVSNELQPNRFANFSATYWGVFMICIFAYFLVFERGDKRRSIGKHCVGIYLMPLEGDEVSYGQIIKRITVDLLSFLVIVGPLLYLTYRLRILGFLISILLCFLLTKTFAGRFKVFFVMLDIFSGLRYVHRKNILGD